MANYSEGGRWRGGPRFTSGRRVEGCSADGAGSVAAGRSIWIVKRQARTTESPTAMPKITAAMRTAAVRTENGRESLRRSIMMAQVKPIARQRLLTTLTMEPI